MNESNQEIVLPDNKYNKIRYLFRTVERRIAKLIFTNTYRANTKLKGIQKAQTQSETQSSLFRNSAALPLRVPTDFCLAFVVPLVYIRIIYEKFITSSTPECCVVM